MYGEGKTESAEQTQAPTESKTEETPAAPAVTETKEAEEAADKAQASKTGTVGELEGGDKDDKGKELDCGD